VLVVAGLACSWQSPGASVAQRQRAGGGDGQDFGQADVRDIIKAMVAKAANGL
jgi:hypothetical protein